MSIPKYKILKKFLDNKKPAFPPVICKTDLLRFSVFFSF